MLSTLFASRSSAKLNISCLFVVADDFAGITTGSVVDITLSTFYDVDVCMGSRDRLLQLLPVVNELSPDTLLVFKHNEVSFFPFNAELVSTTVSFLLLKKLGEVAVPLRFAALLLLLRETSLDRLASDAADVDNMVELLPVFIEEIIYNR